MGRGWSIGKHRVELDINALTLIVRVDGASPPVLALRSNLLGRWSFTVGKRVVELRRVRNLDVARNELWVKGVKVPPSPEPIAWREPSEGARCKPHPMTAASGFPPAAKIECGICRVPVCAGCRAVDGVRCNECFQRAVEELRKADRARRIMGPIIAGVFISSVALYGFVAGSPKALECAAGATMLLGILLIRGLVRERLEARA